jgi:hypothetical protein
MLTETLEGASPLAPRIAIETLVPGKSAWVLGAAFDYNFHRSSKFISSACQSEDGRVKEDVSTCRRIGVSARNGERRTVNGER